MKTNNLKAFLALSLTLFVFLSPLIPSIFILQKKPQIKIEFPENINISQAEIFDGMIANYTFTYSGSVYTTSFNYEFDSGSKFNVTWWFNGTTSSTWVEDETNRVISMPNGPFAFNTGTHAPAWIFTNVSLFDVVPIAVDGDGDHIFNITKERIFNIPGYGSVEVWQLEDLSFPGGIAWYEKSKGILIKGYFAYAMGDYTLEFYDTNIVFNYVSPISGLFDGLYMDYIMAGGSTSITQNILYTGYAINTYNLTSHLSIPGFDDKWNEDTTTRIMSNVADTGMNFNPGIYTPYWIFTNVSLGVNVSIAVDGEGDHIFEVKKSINAELPRFGPITVWELEDLDGLGGIAWYEKNSGILLNGTFVYDAGTGNYTYLLQSTNAAFGYLLPSSFNLITNATDPDTDGIFDLEWTNSEFAKNYSIYEYSSYITEFNGTLTPIVLETTNMTKHLSGYNTGEYYYIATANNNFGITLSGVIKITVAIPSSGGGIPGYSILFLILAGISISFIVRKKWNTIRILK